LRMGGFMLRGRGIIEVVVEGREREKD